MPLNATRVNKNVRDIIVKRRKLVDATDLSSELQIYQSKDDMVHIVVNDETGGQKLVFSTLMKYWSSNLVKKKEDRTPADAIRLTAVLLMADNRTYVTRFLSNKHTTEMVDQAVNPDVALFEYLFLTFKDPTFNEIT